MSQNEPVARLSELDGDLQQQVLATYPRLIKALLKRLGNKVTIPNRELDGLDVYRLTMGMNEAGMVRLEITKRKN